MWTPSGERIGNYTLGFLAPLEILFEYEDEPLTFTCYDIDGSLILAHVLCTEGKNSRYLLSATDERIIGELKEGRLDIFSALRQPRCWIVDFDPHMDILALWRISFEKVPKDHLPKPGVML